MPDPSDQAVINYATPGAHPPPKRFPRGLLGWVLFIGLAVMLFLILQSNKRISHEITLSEFATHLRNGNISEVVIEDDVLRGKLIGPKQSVTPFRCEVPPGMNHNWSFVQWILQQDPNAAVRVDNNKNLLMSLLVPLIPWLLIFAFIWFFIFRQLRKAGSQQAQQKPLPVYIVPPENK